MNAQSLCESVKISAVYQALGGEIRNNRGKAFWRQGDGYSLALTDDKGAWYDHARAEGGGVLDLIELALSCSRREAVSWLKSFAGIELDEPTSAELRRRAAALKEAQEFLSWRQDRLEFLRVMRDDHWQNHLRAMRFLCTHGLNHPRAAIICSVFHVSEARWHDYEARYDRFKQGTDAELLAEFRLQRRRKTP